MNFLSDEESRGLLDNVYNQFVGAHGRTYFDPLKSGVDALVHTRYAS